MRRILRKPRRKNPYGDDDPLKINPYKRCNKITVKENCRSRERHFETTKDYTLKRNEKEWKPYLLCEIISKLRRRSRVKYVKNMWLNEVVFPTISATLAFYRSLSRNLRIDNFSHICFNYFNDEEFNSRGSLLRLDRKVKSAKLLVLTDGLPGVMNEIFSWRWTNNPTFLKLIASITERSRTDCVRFETVKIKPFVTLVERMRTEGIEYSLLRDKEQLRQRLCRRCSCESGDGLSMCQCEVLNEVDMIEFSLDEEFKL